MCNNVTEIDQHCFRSRITEKILYQLVYSKFSNANKNSGKLPPFRSALCPHIHLQVLRHRLYVVLFYKAFL